MGVETLKESELYPPVKKYLEGQGYAVNSEVKHCDVTATKDDELIIVELKTRFNATLLIQAADRQRAADAVYVALPHPSNIGGVKHWKGMCHLLKRLEIGLILIHFLKSGPRVEIAFHPSPYHVRRQRKQRAVIIREIRERSGDYNTGGTTRTRIVTAYREEAIHIATLLDGAALDSAALDGAGGLSPAELRRRGAGDRVQSILSKNFYGWFEKVERGVYKLHPAGKTALAEYPEIVAHFKNG